jgi:hypothetical protein
VGIAWPVGRRSLWAPAVVPIRLTLYVGPLDSPISGVFSPARPMGSICVQKSDRWTPSDFGPVRLHPPKGFCQRAGSPPVPKPSIGKCSPYQKNGDPAPPLQEARLRHHGVAQTRGRALTPTASATPGQCPWRPDLRELREVVNSRWFGVIRFLLQRVRRFDGTSSLRGRRVEWRRGSPTRCSTTATESWASGPRCFAHRRR